MFACGDITPEPLISSPDRELIDSVLVSAQVATGETVMYTLPNAVAGNIYEIRVKRAGASNPDMLVCITENCTPGSSDDVGEVNPDSTFDGTIKWYLPSSDTSLFIYVGGGDESQYSITAGIAPTSVLGTALTSVNIYGVVKSAETANYTLAVTTNNNYLITAAVVNSIGGIDTLRLCRELDCTTIEAFDSPYLATFDGTLHVFVDSTSSDSLFSINAVDQGP